MEEAIIIRWPENLDDKDAQEIVDLSTPELKIKGVQHEDERLFAAFEWTIPTTFIVMVSGLFFKSFMEEAGKDAYQMLKTRLKEYILKRREIKTKLVAASQSPNKLSKTYDQSLSVSMKARLHSRLVVNVMISEKVENQDADDMMDGVFEVLNMLYVQCQEAAPEGQVNGNIRPEELYLLANPETKLWEILSSKEMSDRYRNS
ncbi:hypothetical protein DBR11_06280 [Pedobacter sp. HMWF019]|uniref:hypothetical protein n=1 Tax=Pedobacter sp. HMWF019 TaxID=2056856 RepID=UPI000D388E79|nr:hypothetical protein [Pedobacter sp. HMWF019]PTT01898.1 hypothetical protein DBR11_06280 [Pedobacter sp. HMWF019]